MDSEVRVYILTETKKVQHISQLLPTRHLRPHKEENSNFSRTNARPQQNHRSIKILKHPERI